MLKIKVCDFELTKNIDPSFEGAQGLYASDTDTIYIHSKLTDKTRYSRKTVEYHERAHRLIFKAGVKSYFTELQEEVFCDLWTIMRYPKKKLAGLERKIQDDLFDGGLAWNSKDGNKEKVMRRILKMCGVKATFALVTALT